MKRILKKFLKCLIVFFAFCIVYYSICLIRSSILAKELEHAIEMGDEGTIEELTKDHFFKDVSIREFRENYINNYEHFRSKNKKFSYNFIGIKPHWNHILFEYEIDYPDSQWLIENGENTKKLMVNLEESILDTMRKEVILGNYFEGIGEMKWPSFLVSYENYKDWYGNANDKVLIESMAVNLKNIMDAVIKDIEGVENPKFKKQKVVLAYNIFSNKFTTDGLFYYAARGFSSAQDIVSKFNQAYMDACRNVYSYNDLNQGTICLYNNEEVITCFFYKDDLVWLNNDSNNKNIEEKYIYFIRNNIKRDEIIKSLEAEGYLASDEEVSFINEEGNEITVCLRNNKYLWSDYEEKREYFLENILPKDEIVEFLKNEGYYQGNELYFNKDKEKIRVFFYEDELVWLTNMVGEDISKETEALIEHIIRNNLKQNSIIEFLLNEGYTQMEIQY